jgi:tetratricopeptide (TPR) repeat protein
MKLFAMALAGALAATAVGDASASAAADSVPSDAKTAEPGSSPATAAELRDDLYKRLAESKDPDETAGLVTLLVSSYGRTGSDTADLLIDRSRKAIASQDYDAAEEILDAAIAFAPDEAATWNTRATLRYLDDDYDGSMADIAQTLKREPRHLGALMGMASILTARDKKKEALDVYERVLSIAPHWAPAEAARDKLKGELAGRAL